jgi:hypothetical protein
MPHATCCATVAVIETGAEISQRVTLMMERIKNHLFANGFPVPRQVAANPSRLPELHGAEPNPDANGRSTAKHCSLG